MPKVQARVKSHKFEDGKLLVTLQFNEKVPRISEIVMVTWGSKRTASQNNLYWCFLDWCIRHGGLRDQGHFSPEALHLDLKAYFLSEKILSKGEFKVLSEATTTTLGKAEFGEYVEKVNQFMIDFFHLDTAEFWTNYEENKSWQG